MHACICKHHLCPLCMYVVCRYIHARVLCVCSACVRVCVLIAHIFNNCLPTYLLWYPSLFNIKISPQGIWLGKKKKKKEKKKKRNNVIDWWIKAAQQLHTYYMLKTLHMLYTLHNIIMQAREIIAL